MAIPLPGVPGSGLLEGIQTGGNLFQQLMQPKLERERLAQQWKQHQDNLALQQQAENRLQQLLPYEMQLKDAETKKAALWAKLLSGDDIDQLSGSETGMQQNMPLTPGFQGQGMLSPEFIQQLPERFKNQLRAQTPQNTQENQIKQDIKYNQEAIGSPFQSNVIGENEIVMSEPNPARKNWDKVAGLGGVPPVQTHFDPDGNLIKTYPSGMVTVTRVGLPADVRAEKEAKGKFRAEAYGNAVDSLLSLQDQETNFDRIINALENAPNPENIVGPVNHHLTRIFGNPEDQGFLGEIMTGSGNIVLEAAKNIKGAFTGRDQTMINNMKPNPSDPYFVFLGKLKGMGEINKLTQDRLNLYAEYLDQGIAPHEAMKKARSETDMSSVGEEYARVLEDAKKKSMLADGKLPTFTDKEDAERFLSTLSDAQKFKMLNMMRPS